MAWADEEDRGRCQAGEDKMTPNQENFPKVSTQSLFIKWKSNGKPDENIEGEKRSRTEHFCSVSQNFHVLDRSSPPMPQPRAIRVRFAKSQETERKRQNHTNHITEYGNGGVPHRRYAVSFRGSLTGPILKAHTGRDRFGSLVGRQGWNCPECFTASGLKSPDNGIMGRGLDRGKRAC